MFILDTSIIIEILKGTKNGEKTAEIVQNEKVYSTVFCLYEIMLGVKENELNSISKFFDEITIIKFDEECARESAEIEKELLKIGKKINKVDIFISAISRINNMTLITLDNDFLNINNLKLKLIK